MTYEQRKDITKENLKPGDLIYEAWGATMRGYNFYQVVKIEGSKVYLTYPNVCADGNQEGHTWIDRPSVHLGITKHAKFTARGLRLCGKPGEKDWDGKPTEWKVQHNWGSLSRAVVGEKLHYYGD